MYDNTQAAQTGANCDLKTFDWNEANVDGLVKKKRKVKKKNMGLNLAQLSP